MYKSFALLITVVLKLNNSASNSVCLNQFHIATCAALNLVCLHRATLPGNTPCYITNDELELTVEQNKQFIKTPTHIWSKQAVYQNTNPHLVTVQTVTVSLTKVFPV